METEILEGSSTRLYNTVIMWTMVFYLGLFSAVMVWYLLTSSDMQIYYRYAWAAAATLFSGLCFNCARWDLYNGRFYSLIILNPIDEKKEFKNGVLLVVKNQAWMTQDKTALKLDKLPSICYLNLFTKSIEEKVIITNLSQYYRPENENEDSNK